MDRPSNKRRIDAICTATHTNLKRPSKRVRYGPGSLLPEDLLYVYGESIMRRYRLDELRFWPNKDYLVEVQKGELDEVDHRTTVVNFMIYTSAQLGFYTDTLHLAVRNLDRFLSVEQFPDDKIQLLGLSLLFDAAKHLESNERTPFSNELADRMQSVFEVKVTDNDITNTETKFLIALNFDMMVPTTITFISYPTDMEEINNQNQDRSVLFMTCSLSVIERANPIDGIEFEKLQSLTEFLAELTLLEYKFLRHYPSLIAASIIYYSLLVLNPDEKTIWKPNLRELTGYSLDLMRDCLKDIYDLHRNEDFRKTYDCADTVYSHENFLEVAKLKPVALPIGLEIPADDRPNTADDKPNRRITL